MDAQIRHQLELEIGGIGRDGRAENIDWETGEVLGEAPAVVEPIELFGISEEFGNTPAEPFGRWLLDQKDRKDWISELAKAARHDPGFPKTGDPDAVRKRMEKLGITEADVFEQIDDAERIWSLQCA